MVFDTMARALHPTITSVLIDLLGAGGGGAAKRRKIGYEVIRGTLAELDRLPVARIPDEIARHVARGAPVERVGEGKRNQELFRYCRSIVGYCDSLDVLIDAAQTWAEDRLASPLSPVEIIKTCDSVWRYRGGRRNMVVAGPFVEARQWQALACDITGLALCGYLSVNQGPGARFMLADGSPKTRWRGANSRRPQDPAGCASSNASVVRDAARQPCTVGRSLMNRARNGLPESVGNSVFTLPPGTSVPCTQTEHQKLCLVFFKEHGEDR
jgi:hypothetical protein